METPQTIGKVTVLAPGEPPASTTKWPNGYPGPGYRAQVRYKARDSEEQTYNVMFVEHENRMLVSLICRPGFEREFTSPQQAADAVYLRAKGLPETMAATEKKRKGIAYPAKTLLQLKAFEASGLPVVKRAKKKPKAKDKGEPLEPGGFGVSVFKKDVGPVKLQRTKDGYQVTVPGPVVSDHATVTAAANHVWCLQKGYLGVGDYKAQTGNKRVPAGGGWPFFGLKSRARKPTKSAGETPNKAPNKVVPYPAQTSGLAVTPAQVMLDAEGAPPFCATWPRSNFALPKRGGLWFTPPPFLLLKTSDGLAHWVDNLGQWHVFGNERANPLGEKFEALPQEVWPLSYMEVRELAFATGKSAADVIREGMFPSLAQVRPTADTPDSVLEAFVDHQMKGEPTTRRMTVREAMEGEAPNS